jgi:hypothetical protein
MTRSSGADRAGALSVRSPYLTAPEAAVYLRYERADGSPNLNALYIARSRHGLKGRRRGGRLLFKVADLDAFLEDEGAFATGASRATTRYARFRTS